MSMEANLKVNIISDSSPLEDLSNILMDLIDLGSQVGDTISSSLSQMGDEATKVSSNLGEIDSTNIEDVSDATEDAIRNMDNYTESMQRAEGESSNFKNSMEEAASSSSLFSQDTTSMISVSDKLTKISGELGSLNNEFIAINDTVGVVSANTGYSAEQVRQLATAYSEVGTSATDAAIYLQRMQNAGLEPNSQAMNTAMNNAHLLQTAFRMTGSETDKMMGTLARAGVDVNNLGSSFNALGYISSQTNIPIDTFNSVLTTSGANMQKYGINVDQAAVALSQINSRYRTARQAGAAFNQAVEESGGDVSKLEELLDLEAGSLSNASSETAKAKGTVQDLSKSYVEAQGWTGKFNEKLDDLTMSLSGILGPASNVAATLSSTFSGASDIHATIKMVKDLKTEIGNVRTTISEAGGTVNFLKDNFGGLKDKATTLKTTMTGLKSIDLGSSFLTMIPGITSAGAASQGASTGFTALGISISMTAIWVIIIIAAIIAVIAILWYLYNTNESVRNAIDWLSGSFQGFIGWLTSSKGAIKDVMNFFNRMGNEASELGGIISGGLSSAWNILTGAINTALGPLRDAYNTLQDIGNAASNAWNSLTGGGAAGGANLMTAEEKAYVASLSTSNYTPANSDVMDKIVNNGGHTFNLTVEVGSVDNSDRVHEIVEAVRKELAWSNATAGRTA